MNLITKLAYNALTKTIQAIAPGGVSLLMPAVEQTIVSMIFTPNGAGSTASSALNIELVKIGRIVTLTLPIISTTPQNNSQVIQSSAAIPAGFRPTATTFIMSLPIKNGGADQAAPGLFRINASGELLFYRDGTTTLVFGNGAVGGVSQATVFTFLVA